MNIPEKPEEVTLDWLNRIFKSHGIKVQDFSFTGDTGNGRGFMGTLEQAELKISRLVKSTANILTSTYSDNNNDEASGTETLHIIFKTSPTDPFRKAYASNDGFSSREVNVYTEILPAWEKFLDKREVPWSQRFRHPFCYYGTEQGQGEAYRYVLVLENLSAPLSQFQMWNGGFNDPLPWDDASPVIRQIAKFHATGIAYKMENGIDSYYSAYPKLNHVVSPFFHMAWQKGFEIAKEVILATVDEHDIPNGLFEQFDKLKEDENKNLLLKWFTDPTMSSGDMTTTICHNDLHSNNLALHEGHTSAVLFDYQVCNEMNPMKDLSFFLILNCDLDVSTRNLARSLRVYHDEFAKFMTTINMDFKYPIERITKDYDMFLAFSIVHIMTGAQIWITGHESTNESKRRFASVIIDAYERGILNFPSEA